MTRDEWLKMADALLEAIKEERRRVSEQAEEVRRIGLVMDRLAVLETMPR